MSDAAPHPSIETNPTIFGKILRGEIPCHTVYEDDHVLAFLDIAPLSPGHVLVIPKEHAATLADLSDDSSAAIGRVLPRLCRAVATVSGTENCNVLQNNGAAAHQAVFHVHFHIIPKMPDDRGLDITWNTTDAGDAPATASQIAAAL